MQGVHEHKSRVVPGFSDRYDIDDLVWLEIHAIRSMRLLVRRR
jgi:hypothetical protein